MTIRGYQLLALMALGLVAYTHAECNLMIGCDDCVDPEPSCAKCEDGKFPGNDTDENECFECTGNCTTCDSATTCKTCEPYYVLKTDGTCEGCSPGCVNCSMLVLHACNHTESTCHKCETGNFLEAGKCETCPTNCDSCSNNDTCSNCSANYVKNSHACSDSDKQCLSCNASCTSCSGEEVDGVANCTECTPDKYLNAGVCSECLDTECVVCSADGQCEIDGCKKGFYKKEHIDQCAACDYECDECDLVQNQTSCTDCKTNFGYKNGMTCDACPDPNCQICNTNGFCETCTRGYFLTNSTCTACGDNCDKCTDQSTCTGCSTGYFIDKEIPDVCTLCSNSTGDASGLANCVACRNTKSSADAADTECTDCAAGFSPKGDGSECLACNVTNCVACNAVADKCSKCSPGFFLHPTNFTCLDACKDSNCKTCTAADTTGTCSYCNPNFTLTDANTCASCPAHCQDDSCEWTPAPGTAVCDSCVLGYELHDGACVECPAHCYSCDVNATTGETVGRCESCKNGYWLNTQKCGGCPANCDDCALEDGVMVCTVCAAGYTKDSNHDCKECPSNCEECSAGTSITCNVGKCKTGYGVSADKTSCEACAVLTKVDNCATCGDYIYHYNSNSNDSAECTSCATGYFIQDDHMKCLENFPGCANSEDNQVECINCSPSYNMTEDKRCFSQDVCILNAIHECSPPTYPCSTDVTLP